MNLNADTFLIEAMEKHNIHLSVLVAETAIWANPAAHRILMAENGTGCFFPYTRRLSKGEKKGAVVEGIRLDDNTYANHAIKQATGVGRNAKGFEACHIWPITYRNKTCCSSYRCDFKTAGISLFT